MTASFALQSPLRSLVAFFANARSTLIFRPPMTVWAHVLHAMSDVHHHQELRVQRQTGEPQPSPSLGAALRHAWHLASVNGPPGLGGLSFARAFWSTIIGSSFLPRPSPSHDVASFTCLSFGYRLRVDIPLSSQQECEWPDVAPAVRASRSDTLNLRLLLHAQDHLLVRVDHIPGNLRVVHGLSDSTTL